MPFTESADGADRSQYVAGILHVASNHWVSVQIGSNNADGTVPEEVAEQIFADIAVILSADSRFSSASVTRTRPAVDTWSPPVVPPIE